MNCNECGLPFQDDGPPMARNRQWFSGQGQRSSCTQRHYHLGSYKFELLFQPPTVMLHFTCSGFAVDPTFATLFEFEVLYSVCDVGFTASDTCFLHGTVQEPTRWPDKGLAL